MQILVETSARHIHLSNDDLKILFGEDHELTFVRELSQPGQFVCQERVDIVGPKNSFKNVVILGPTRKQTQVEISLTDARFIGVSAPIRESGQLEGSSSCKIVGPNGEIEIEQGLIIAKRHIHTTPEDAEKMGVADQQIVSISVNSPERRTIFGDVVVRVNPDFRTVVHLDTDESNAANAGGEVYCTIC